MKKVEITEGKKKCCRCKESLSVSAFGPSSSSATGLQSYCIQCLIEYRAEHREEHLAKRKIYYRENREAILEKAATYREDKGEVLVVRQRMFRVNNPELMKNYHRKYSRSSRHHITVDTYDMLFALQGGVCAICNSVNPDGKRLDIDHDHACCTSKYSACGHCVRGLICRACNVALGRFHDDVSLLLAAAEYLAKHRSQISFLNQNSRATNSLV